jgi:uncharacterized protein (TIGR02569 family)
MAPVPVAGGQGITFRAGDVALKPCEHAQEAQWLGEVLERVEENGFRLSRPVRAAHGPFVVDGWCAFSWVDGETTLRGRWSEAVAAIRAFHHMLSHVSRPELLDRRENVFALADRLAWGDLPIERAGPLGTDGERLLRVLRPVTASAQLIHGDPSEGNLLFQEGLAPAIIDVAPYWHPPEYAVAMFVADGIAWSGATLELLTRVRDVSEMRQLLARAVLFRLIVAKLFRGGDAGVAIRSAAYAPVVDAVERWW